MNWCILIPLLVGLLSAIFGYLLGRLLKSTNNADADVYRNRISILERELDACKKSLEPDSSKQAVGSSGAGNSGIGSSMMASNLADSTEAKTAESVATDSASMAIFDTDAAKRAMGKRVKENDLTIVEGIGPKIRDLFHNHDVNTWAKLANCSIEKCQSILNSGGERYKIHRPGTWPKQSRLAAEGKWLELKDWQDILDGGK